MDYGYQRLINKPFENVNQEIRESLQKQGFGVLTEISVNDTLKKKLGVDFRKYLILGACNPAFAYEALEAELEIGLLLPCNVVLWENENGTTTLSAIDAQKMLGVSEMAGLEEVAEKVNSLLRQAVDAV
ncbi:MAG: DUF302 domain-containing protein [Candidatus Neomarinimicrobiota bacterium]